MTAAETDARYIWRRTSAKTKRRAPDWAIGLVPSEWHDNSETHARAVGEALFELAVQESMRRGNPPPPERRSAESVEKLAAQLNREEHKYSRRVRGRIAHYYDKENTK